MPFYIDKKDLTPIIKWSHTINWPAYKLKESDQGIGWNGKADSMCKNILF